VRRRDFITLLGGTAAGWPVTARAQQQPATLAVGFLADGTPEGFAPRLAAVKRGLYEAGFTDGQNVAIEPRWAHRNYELLPSLAGDLVRRKVSVIVTAGSEKVTRVAKDATTTIPIVAIVAGDPVERGLVASINHPGGNLTVVSLFTSSNVLMAKRVELLHEVAPKVTTIGWLVDTNILDYDDELHELHSAAAAFGLKLAIARVEGNSDLELAVASLVRDGSGTLIESGPIVYENRARVVAAAARATVPMLYEWRTFVDEGGLMSYGNDINSVYRQAGVYAGRVLRGENVGDLPVVQQSKIELIINLKTAKALGLSFPITLLGRADEVIE
jgi:putative tryptophan/tyrosine transport system substrate-binding protein